MSDCESLNSQINIKNEESNSNSLPTQIRSGEMALVSPSKENGKGQSHALPLLTAALSHSNSTSSMSVSTPIITEVDCKTSVLSCKRPAPSFLISHPTVKKARYELCDSGNKPKTNKEIKSAILKWKNAKLNFLRDSYNSHLVELFFLSNDGNLMEMAVWRKKPTAELLAYHKKNRLEGDSIPTTLSSDSVIEFASQDSPAVTKKEPQDQIVEKAKQEAYVVSRIAQLRKDGLWTEKRLPKVHEPARPKCHWDYLLEEMVWLSADFAQERKWKKAAAKKCAKMVHKYFQDKELAVERAHKEEEMRLKKIASFMAREVRTFWSNVEKLVHYKINSKHEEKKKKALDQQLSFIVDQTEKYSGMLAESMKRPVDTVSTRSDTPSVGSFSDEEFEPASNSEDDEQTICKEEDDPSEQADEVKLLQQEKDQTIDDLLTSLPPEYLASLRGEPAAETTGEQSGEAAECPTSPKTRSGRKRKLSATSDAEEPPSKERKVEEEEDVEYKAEEEVDCEDTLDEQEKHEGPVNHIEEIAELEAENEMSIEALRAKYSGLSSVEPMSEDEESEASSDSESEGLTGESDSEHSQEEEMQQEVGLKSLLEEANAAPGAAEKADKELEEATAVAEALQPKGFTLSSATVTTPVPFLLKHSLREYQHVGLDWLTTMYQKNLNGILADEMGLGKTIQTISLLAHLACETNNWGPHLIVVPTSVMLNWEMELKKWCPAFKILTYFGSQKERKMKRQGWTKQNAFHVCITSYKLVIQDHQSFRRKKWKYFILDEAQNIKNFKSKRWQLLLNFQSDRRLLLTGTPLQNNLMELWSLMHFLMPHVFASHREFKEWFSNPVTGMIQGNSEYNDNIIKRLHKVLRPFILRRLKSEVEQQMPKKYEHVVMCRLSKRQRFLYEEFMSRTKTRETLAAGNFLSVINVLMQLRKVCNHPNLFEERPTVSPFMMEPVNYSAPSCCWNITDYDPFKHIDLLSLNLLLCDLELALTAFAAHRIKRFQCPPKLITEIDSATPLPPRCPPGKIRLHVRQSNKPVQQQPAQHQLTYAAGVKPRPIPSVVGATPPPTPSPAPSVPFSSGSNVRYQLIQHQGALRAIPIAVNNSNAGVTSQRPLITSSSGGQATILRQGASTVTTNSTPTTTPNKQQQIQLFTHSGQQLLLTTGSGSTATNRQGTVIAAGQQMASSSQQGNSNTIFQKLQSIPNLKSLQGSVITMGPGGRQVLRLQSPANVSSSSNISAAVRHSTPNATIQRVSTPQQTPQVTPQHTPQATPLPSPTHTNSPVRLTQEQHKSPVRPRVTKEETKAASKGSSQAPRSIFYLNDLEEARSESRKAKLNTLATLNTRKCRGYPIYGGDLVEVVTLSIAESKNKNWRKLRGLENFVMTAEQRLHHMKYMLNEFVFCVPAVISKPAQLILHHPDPSGITRLENKQVMVREILQPVATKLHCITNATLTQFPDPRLIQYDCGKLQILDTLLRKLKAGDHRVLIFTQMTKMLDVFEAFLNYHGHIYLRLDGTTKVQDRQILMERFNQDKRIFVFILSTRSGGIGVNLTGADTVIFYDSDWNPTMDAQAQDRCHRIGQTRDVHIYRLISEKSIEENILKKANQKRLLGNLAIEGGNFTTAYFKEQSIQDLFQVSTEQDSSRRMAELLDKDTTEESAVSVRPGAFENALAAAEDETDVVAARHAMAEAAADLAEFDENIPLNDDTLNTSAATTGEEPSKVEQEINKLMLQLTGVERFAMNVLERADEGIAYEQSRLELELEQQKREWELDRQRAIANNEEMMSKSRQEEMEEPLTVPASQVWLPVGWLPPGEDLETWMPPTPPRGAGDQYLESHTSGYSTTLIPEAALPPVVCKTNRPKRPRLVQTGAEGLQKIPKHEENYVAPRSMFDKYSSVMSHNKFRREIKLPPKCRPLARGGTLISIGRGGMAMNGGPKIEEPWLDWNNQEETLIIVWRLLLNSATSSPYVGHTPNFEMVSDQINCVTRCFRSGRYCRMRYEHFVSVSSTVQQREGLPSLPSIPSDRVTIVANAIATRNEKNNKTVKTSRSSASNNQASVNITDNTHYSSELRRRFSDIKKITNLKTPTAKALMSSGSIYGRATKQAQMLEGQNIFWDTPLTPGQIASTKLERAKEKQKATKGQHLQFQAHPQLQQQSHIVHHQPTIQVDNLLQQSNQLVSASSSGGATQQIIGSVVVSKGNSGSVIMSSGSIIVSQAALLQGGMGIVSMASTSGDSMPQVVTVASLGSGLSSDFAGTSRVSGVHPSTAPVTSIGTKTAKLALQELRPASSSMVTVASLAGAKLSQPLQVAGFQAKGTAPRSLPNQLTYIRQHPLPQNITLQQHKQDAGQTIKRLQIGTATAGGQKLPVAVSGGSLQGITAIQVSQAGRAQLVKHAVGGTAVVVSTTSAGALAHLQQGLSSSGQGSLQQQTKTITRTVSEVEMNAILRRQQGKGGAQVAQVIGKPQRGTVVKGSAVGHLQLATTKGGAGSGSSLGLQIIQGGASVHKGGMQHIQVFKQVPQQAMHHLASSAHGATIGAKAVSVSAGNTSKLLPANQQGIKQTIQVVSAGASGVGNAPAGSIRVSAGTGSGASLTLPVSAVRMATPQLFSQVSAALQHGQTVTVPVRGTAGGVRLSQPIAIQTQGQQISIQHQPTNQNNGKNQGGSQG